jgi:SAM-dependent methyltransferase
VLAPYVAEAGARFTGVEISPKLVSIARKRHGLYGTFIQADVRRLSRVRQIKKQSYDACVFLLSLQDMEPLQEAIQSAAWALKSGGRLVALLTHPCFRVPRQSGWGWDEGRKLRYRRIDRYLTEMEVPMKKHPGRTKGVSRSYHRPLSAYVNELVKTGLFINQVLEIPCDLINHRGKRAKAHRRADQEFPLFMGLRAVKSDWP